MAINVAIVVAIIGAGPLGRRLAFHAARAGFAVVLEDVMPASLRHAAEALREQLSEAAMPLVSFAHTVEQAVRNADLVIDCVPDELESKLEIFSLLDRMAPPRTVFATPTLHLSISDLASCTYRPGQGVALAIDAAQLSHENGYPLREIAIWISSHTTPQTQSLVSAFWSEMGYSATFQLDTVEAMLR